MTGPEDIEVKEATLEDVPSLTTAVARSFHPVNNYHVKVFPDTPIMRDWFTRVYTNHIEKPNSHIITAIDSQAQDPALRAVGVLCLSLLDAEDKTAGFWTTDYTPDHGMKLFQPAYDGMVKHRSEMYTGTGKRHYLLELFGVDHAYKGTGLGKRMLQKACDLADEGGYDIFVEANMYAKAFYEKFEFVSKGEIAIKMPDGLPDYIDYMLVRPGRGKA